MKREILFKGKHIHAVSENEHLDGRWIEGYLVDHNYIHSPELEGEFLIDENTICQYTGSTDKNNRKIFEGDILSAYLDSECPDEKTYVQITWNGFSWCTRENTRDDVLTEWDCKTFEVCGNIFDNPKLLKDNDDPEFK